MIGMITDQDYQDIKMIRIISNQADQGDQRSSLEIHHHVFAISNNDTIASLHYQGSARASDRPGLILSAVRCNRRPRQRSPSSLSSMCQGKASGKTRCRGRPTDGIPRTTEEDGDPRPMTRRAWLTRGCKLTLAQPRGQVELAQFDRAKDLAQFDRAKDY